MLPLHHLDTLDRITLDHWTIDLLLGLADWFLHLITALA